MVGSLGHCQENRKRQGKSDRSGWWWQQRRLFRKSDRADRESFGQTKKHRRGGPHPSGRLGSFSRDGLELGVPFPWWRSPLVSCQY